MFTTKLTAALAGLALVGTAALTGCSMQSASEGKATTSDNVTADKSNAPAETQATEETVDTNAKFGETVSYEGLDLSVSTPEAFTPSQYASGGDLPNNVLVTFTLKNTSSENFDPAGVYATMSSGGVEAEGVYDSDQGLAGSPTTTVPAGQTVTWKQGFNVTDPANLVLDVSPGAFEYESATFTS